MTVTFIRALDVLNRCMRCRRCKRWVSVVVKDDRYHRGVSDLCADCWRRFRMRKAPPPTV